MAVPRWTIERKTANNINKRHNKIDLGWCESARFRIELKSVNTLMYGFTSNMFILI